MVITEQLKKEIAEIARKYNIALFVLFGSQARGDVHKKSDVDIAYSSREPLPLHEENKMAVALQQLFRTSHVDIVNLSAATSPLLLKNITDEGMPLFEAKPSLFNELFLYALRVYREAKPLFALREEYLFQRINQYKRDLAHA